MALTAEGSRTDRTVMVRVAGRLDGETAGDLDRVCQQWLTPEDRAMVLDFTETSYISSAGLSIVLKAGKGMDRQGGRLLICGLAPKVKQVFVLSGFDSLFPLFDTREGAMAACGQ